MDIAAIEDRARRAETDGAGTNYDAVLIVGFGGPERREDVLPFLENVTRGRNVPRTRLLEVAEHYDHFEGKSPINDQVRELIAALRPELEQNGISLPVYWGNRNWHPFLVDTLAEMSAHRINRSLAVVLSAYSSYSSCRQYREDVERARAAVGPDAPKVDKVRVFYNHPDFIAANAARLREGIERLRPAVANPFKWRSRPTVFPWPWRETATTSTSSAKHAGWSRPTQASTQRAGSLCIKVAAAGPRTRGSTRISSITLSG